MSIYEKIRSFSNSVKLLLFIQWLTTVGYFSVIPFLVVYLVDNGFSPSFATLQLSLFLFGSYGATFFGGILSDKYSSKIVMQFGLILKILCYLAYLFFHPTYYIISFLSLVLGTSKGFYTPASKTYITRISDADNILLFSVRSTINNIGLAIGSLIGGFFLTQGSNLFFLVATVSQLIAYILLYSLKTDAVHNNKKDRYKEVNYRILINSKFIYYCIIYLFFNFLYMQLESAFPLFASFTWGNSSVSKIFLVNAIIVILLQVVLNDWLHRKTSSIFAIIVGFCSFATAFLLLNNISSLGLFIIAIAIYTIGEIIIDPHIDAVVSSSVPYNTVGTAFGILGIFGLIGGVAGNTLSGYLLGNQNSNLLWMICFTISLLVIVSAGFRNLINKENS